MGQSLRVFLGYVGFQTWFPLSLDLLAGYARRQPNLADNVEFLIESYDLSEAASNDLMNVYPFSKVLSDIQRFKPNVVALSTYMWNIQEHSRLCRLVKNIDPSIVTVLGGPNMHTASHTEFMMRNYPEIDISVRNEGEITFSEILTHVLKGDLNTALPSMLGVTFRSDDGRIYSTPRRPDIGDMEQIVLPYANGEFLLHEPEGRIEHDMVMIETFRGCYRKCRFCVWSKEQPRAWKPETIEQELRSIIDMGIERCYIVDSEFGVNKASFKRFLELIRDCNKKTIFSFFPQIGYLHEDENLQLILDSGVRLASFGIQSINEMTLKTSDRVQNLARFEKVMQKLDEYGIGFDDTHLILGLPGDNYESFKNSVDYVLSKAKQRLSIFNFRVLPGTEFWEESHLYGLKWLPETPYFILETQSFPRNQMLAGFEIQRVVHAFVNFAPHLFQILVGLRGVKHTDLIEEMIARSRCLQGVRDRYGINQSVEFIIGLDEVEAGLIEAVDICAPPDLSAKTKEQLHELARFEARINVSKREPSYATKHAKSLIGETGDVGDFSDRDSVSVKHGFSLQSFKYDVSQMYEQKSLVAMKKSAMKVGFTSGAAFELDDLSIDLIDLAKSPIKLEDLQNKMQQLHGLTRKQFKTLVKNLLKNMMLQLFRQRPQDSVSCETRRSVAV